MFDFIIKDYAPVKESFPDGTQRIIDWKLASCTRYTVQIWPGKNLLGIEREKNTSENDPPRRWPDFEKKVVKVKPDFDFCYKLQKTQIRARGGAEGLYKFIQKETEGGAQSCFVRRIVEYAMDEMREARTA